MTDHFSVGETMFRWSTQDNHAVDRVPYIGRVGDDGDLYVATGFAGWGMTNGTVAGLMISDALRGTSNRWAALYDPDRLHLAASAKAFVTENTSVAAGELRAALDRDEVESLDAIAPGQAAIVSGAEGDRAVYRDSSGGLHAVSAACTHMGCTVSWNEAESSWDCPCHGSRFAPDGRVLHGPALSPLDVVEIPDTDPEDG